MRRWGLALLAAAACASAGKLRASQEALRSEMQKARQAGAERCAPKELALAAANAEFASTEIELGNARRAEEHLRVAEEDVRRALALSKECAAPATVREKPAVVIEKVDSDGDGVPDVDDGCPTLPGPPENRGCPLSQDADGDGIPDDIDRCPLDPEDKDGFQDEDGCPDPDNDNDGIVDAMDACPNNPGPLENRGCPPVDRDGDGVPDAADKCPEEPGLPPDGCPKKYGLVEVKPDRIEMKQQVHFAYRTYKVLPASFRLLDQVARVLSDYPKIRVRIEGHTDSAGSESSNLKLSQKRAEAVGYGPTRPVASNKTNRGRAQNRRTEFRVISVGK